MIDGHVHIERGPYTIDWINEFVRYGLERGLSQICFLEHSHRFIEFKDIYTDIAGYNEFQRSWFENKMKLQIEEYKNLILEARNREFPLKINFGLEVCYVEGTEDIVRNALDGFRWDFVTGSVHWIDNWGFDHKKEFWDGKDVDKVYARYYDTMKKLIRSELFNNVAHPDSIKCFGHYPSFDLAETYIEIADLLNKHNMQVEQSAGLYMNYGYNQLGMSKTMYDILKSKSVRILTASDAHRPEDTGRYIKELYELY